MSFGVFRNHPHVLQKVSSFCSSKLQQSKNSVKRRRQEIWSCTPKKTRELLPARRVSWNLWIPLKKDLQIFHQHENDVPWKPINCPSEIPRKITMNSEFPLFHIVEPWFFTTTRPVSAPDFSEEPLARSWIHGPMLKRSSSSHVAMIKRRGARASVRFGQVVGSNIRIRHGPMGYPLVMSDIAIEHGHWNSGFSMIFPLFHGDFP